MDTKPKTINYTTKYIVMSDGVMCGVSMSSELGLGAGLCKARGLLVKKPNRPKYFRSIREAKRMVTITERAILTLKGTLVDNHPRLRPLLDGARFKIVPFKRKKDLTLAALAEQPTLGIIPN